MPELPEVETIVRDLRKKIISATICDVEIHDGRVVRQTSPAEFIRRLEGQTLAAINRRGKAIVMDLDPSGQKFIVQLMMTGQLIARRQPQAQRDTKVTFRLSNQQWLHYNDYRTFGRLQVIDDLSEIPYFSRLGPEPLSRDFTLTRLKDGLQKRKAPIKTLLLNHHFVAGIGNIYASEILFASRIHPLRSANSLKEHEIAVLHEHIRVILKEAVECRGTSMNTYRDASGREGQFMNRIRVYGREYDPCWNCRKPVMRMFQAGRSTFYCDQCQK